MTRVNIIHGEELKTDDTAPDLRAQLIAENGAGADLSSVNEVRLVLAEAGNTDTTVVDDDTTGNVTITDQSNGYVEYAWQSGDTGRAQTLVGEFIVTPSSNEQEHYPNSGFFNVYIEEGLV